MGDLPAKSDIEQADTEARERLCAVLARTLTQRMRESGDFHGGVRQAIAELRRLGHELWSFTEEDDTEVWAQDGGLVITFTPLEVDVEWSSLRPS